MSQDKGLKAWFRQRFPLATFGYEVPPHANTFLFSLGGITMISVVILVVTGIILAQFYSPNPETANQSIRILLTQYRMGSFIRGLHAWAAQIAVISLLLHLLRVLFYGSYKKPREINWLIGVVLFVLMVGLFFTGTVIKWDQEGFEALSHTIAVSKLLGPLGFYLSPTFISNISLLGKFFTLHLSLLPILLMVVLVIHLYLIKMLKVSPLPWEPSNLNPGKHTFVQHFYKLIGYFFVVLGLIFILSVLFPPELGPVPVKGVEASKPPWLFMGIFSIENWAGIPGLVWGSLVVFALLILVPVIDRGKSQLFRDRKAVVSLYTIICLVMAGLTLYAYVTKPKQHIGMGSEGKNIPIADNTKDIESQKGQPPVVKGINESLGIVNQLKTAVANKDAVNAKTLAAKLDEALDPIKKDIKAKDPDLVNDLKSDDLIDLFKDASPDFAKANSLLDSIQKALEKAKDMFTGATGSMATKDGMAGKLSAAMDLVDQIKDAVKDKDMTKASSKAGDLDKALDPLKDDLKSKDPSLVKDLDTDSLMDMLKDASPDIAKINSMLDAMDKALDKAKDMYAK